MKYQKAVSLAFLSGILFLLTTLYASTEMWEEVTEWLSDEYPDYEDVFKGFLLVILFLASLGGITIILGGILIGKERLSLGKFLIAIGAGFGLISVILAFVTLGMKDGIVDGTERFIELFLPLQWLAIILAIFARKYAKKEEKWK
ncbi:MAG: hypothetical protein Q6362_011975 [Candidatus Wukongarchaeota archaeon]|nr:hypothetical protein [Candidatus Wukongarchaeota archaeon]